MKNYSKYWLLATLLPLLTLSCSPEPEPIDFGEDQCVYCKMGIVNPNYGAELVTDKGKVFKFDAAECMANYMEEPQQASTTYAYTLAIAFDTPGELHSAEELTFLISPQLPSPMGANLTAFKNRERALEAQEKYGGDLLSWEEVKNRLSS